MMVRKAMRVSPQQADPLSWIARPYLPFAFAVTALAYGTATTLATWSMAPRPWLDLGATALMVLACLWIEVATRPMKPRFGPARASVSVVFAVTGLALSAFAAMGSPVAVTFWWAPVALAIVIATFAAYASPIEVLAYGTIFTVASGLSAWFVFVSASDSTAPFSPISVVVVAIYPILTGTLAAVVFCLLVVLRSRQLLAGEGATVLPDAHQLDEAAHVAEVATVARLGSRVAPFLRAVAEAGEVTTADRALAGQLARRLRAELVSSANTNWLESLATAGRIYVVDPEHLADNLTAAQRTAIRGLLLAAINDPHTASGSLFIELRGQDDGSTAVALSLDLDLPEGRRIMLIAPYYVALTSTVADLSWDKARDLLKFTVPPRQRWARNPRGYLPE
jgi:hypothetical protein